jgi:hypothetical protein
MACAGPAWSGALPVGRRLRGRGSPSRGWRVVGRLAQSRQVVFHFSSRAVRVAGFQMAEQVRPCLPAGWRGFGTTLDADDIHALLS